MKTTAIKQIFTKGVFLGLTLASTFLYSCDNRQETAGSDGDNAESEVPAVTPADSMNYGLNGQEGGSDTIGRTGPGIGAAGTDTISIGTGATGGSGGTTGGGDGTPHDRDNPHLPDNKQ